MENIYKASIVKRDDDVFRGRYEYTIGYFKSSSNAWSKLGDYFNEKLCGLHIGFYTKDGQDIKYDVESAIKCEDILTDIKNGCITFVRDFCHDYYFYVEPIKVED